MSNYKLNPKIRESTPSEIFNLLLDFINIGKSYETLSGKKRHKIIKIEGSILIDRLDAQNKPEISFSELLKVIDLFKNGNSFNTNSTEYKKLLKRPVNKTPLLSILLASNIIVKE